MSRRQFIWGLGGCIGLLLGCTDTPHNNVLLFGTDTKFGLDVSSNAAAGGSPQVSVGYRRSEAAWLPLAANTFNCAGGACNVSTATEGGKVQTFAATRTGADGKLVSRDSYSVFGSFGARFSGNAGAGAEASGGLAQFFATGVAAQELAENTAVANALKLEDPSTAVAKANVQVEQARADQADAKAREAQAIADAAITKANEASDDEARLILARCGGPSQNVEAWKAIVMKADALAVDPKLGRGNRTRLLAASSNEDVTGVLRETISGRTFLIKNLDALCPETSNS